LIIPEPFLATLGVMLYPATDEHDPPKARAFAAQWLAKPLSRYHAAGHRLDYEHLARIAADSDESLSDLDERIWGGTATGELFKVLFALSHTDATLTSWNNAARIAELTAARVNASGSRSAQWKARRQFLSVAHLWAAWSIREGRFEARPELGYHAHDDFQSFLTEAEILRRWGQTWRPPRKGSKPLLPPDVWQVPENWQPPIRQPGWPETGKLPVLTLPEGLLATLRPAGRPRRRDDTVIREPVSVTKFPANRENNREFHRIRPSTAISCLINARCIADHPINRIDELLPWTWKAVADKLAA
jgi:hypothetical protein